MKKTTTTRTKTAAKLPPAPAGLKLLLAMFDAGNEDEAIYALAKNIVGDLDEFREGFRRTLDPDQVLSLVYPDLAALTSKTDEVVAPASFMKAGVLLGAAAAWVVMTDLQGGTR